MKFFKIYLITVSVIFFGIACSNQDEQNEIAYQRKLNNTEKALSLHGRVSDSNCTLLLNSQNPYNFVGQIHNEILTSYLTTYDDITPNVNLIINRINLIALNNPNFVATMDSSYAPINPKILISGGEDFDNQFGNIVRDLNTSAETKQKLSELIDYFFTKAYQLSTPTYEEIDNYLITYENEVINDTLFDTNEKRVLLSAVSTARHSNCFWYNYFDVTNSSNQASAKRAWWQWLIVGVADVAGAAVGSIPATATSGVAGATIVGAAVGASTLAFTMTNPNNK